MTAPTLLALILAALLAQLCVGVGFAVWRARVTAGEPAAPGPDAAPRPPPGAWTGWRTFRIARREVEDIAQTQVSFHLEPVDGEPLPPFRPGQYLTVSVVCPGPPAAPGPRTLTRCYSLSDRPDPARYRITVKRVGPPADRPDLPPGVVSNHLHDAGCVGGEIRLRCPAGAFVLDDDIATPAVLIAGGVGITPVMSMVQWSRTAQPGRPIYVYYAVRHGGEHAFKPALEAIATADPAFRLTVAYSRPGPRDRPGVDFQHAGRIDMGLLEGTLGEGRRAVYVCGPPAMMETLVPALRARGVAEDDLHFEAFGPATGQAPSGAAQRPDLAAEPLDVAFRSSGRTLSWDGLDANLLDFAERNGIAVESGCRTGACGACETRVLAGTVRYVETPGFDVSPGHCLLCVGAPASPLRLEA